MATYIKRGKTWRAQVRRMGVSKSSTFDTKAEAVAWAEEIEHEIKRINKGKPKFTRTDTSLLEEHDIISSSTPAESTCGIYFLILFSRIVYVGKSIDAYCRIAEHKARGRKFTHFKIVQCHPDQLTSLENLYIQKFKPEGNRSKITASQFN